MADQEAHRHSQKKGPEQRAGADEGGDGEHDDAGVENPRPDHLQKPVLVADGIERVRVLRRLPARLTGVAVLVAVALPGGNRPVAKVCLQRWCTLSATGCPWVGHDVEQ